MHLHTETVGAGLPIVVLPGGPGFSHGYLRPGLDPLADVALIVYVDLRNTGRSEHGPIEECTLEQMADDVAALKKRYSGDLLLYGIGELANYLARQNLVDEVRFWVHPYIWGDGVRPFHAGELPLRLRLISATTYASGIVRLAYQPAPE